MTIGQSLLQRAEHIVSSHDDLPDRTDAIIGTMALMIVRLVNGSPSDLVNDAEVLVRMMRG